MSLAVSLNLFAFSSSAYKDFLMNLNTPTPDKGNKLFSEIFWLLSLNLQKTCGTGKSLDELKFSQVFVIDLFIFLCSALIIEHFSFVR